MVNAFFRLVYEWTSTGTWNEATTLPPIRLGLLALTCMDILFLLSISTLRQICYPVFYASHVVAAIVMLAAVRMPLLLVYLVSDTRWTF